jgi:1,4-dihydroxy-6-naphthoate synthase
LKKLSIAISPCPNDTFIFENIYNKTVFIDDIEFEFHFLDIQELNQAASQAKFDIIKISFAHWPNVAHQYAMLHSGGAMGFGVGPLLVCKKNEAVNLSKCSIAIPGINTTANLLLSYLYPEIKAEQKQALLFSDIEDAILNNKYDAGVLIHEGRFTYQERGLHLIADLGTLWQQKENLPIPLGCIIAKQNLGADLCLQIEQLITASISNYDEIQLPIISPFITQHAQEMSTDVMLQHINLYVNEFSKHFGENGMNAIAKLLQVSKAQNLS